MGLVDIAIPVTIAQSDQWWLPLMTRILEWERSGIVNRIMTSYGAMPDKSKNLTVDEMLKARERALLAAKGQNGNNDGLTSYNRDALVEASKADDASEWLFFIDHDTVPPLDGLPRLLSLHRPFVAGVYHHRNNPYLPHLYRRDPETGLFRTLTDYERGALIEVDATGMGCTLIHMDVFNAIHDQYRQFMRPNGTRFLVHEDDVSEERFPSRFHDKERVYVNEYGGHAVTPVKLVPPDIEERFDYPYFEMEHGRTEDIGFCERAQRCGFRIYVDTSVECQHLQLLPVTGDHFRSVRDEMKIVGGMPSSVTVGGVLK